MLSGRAESRASVFPGTDRDLATALRTGTRRGDTAGYEFQVVRSNGLWTTDSITMVSSAGKTLAQPGPAYGGQAFQDTWRAAS
jgi:hypothetical protein